MKNSKWDIWEQKHNEIKCEDDYEIIDLIDKTKPSSSMNILGSFTVKHPFFNKKHLGIKHGMIHKQYGYGGKTNIIFDDSLSKDHFVNKPYETVYGIDLGHRNRMGINIKRPVIPVIDCIASQLS